MYVNWIGENISSSIYEVYKFLGLNGYIITITNNNID